MDERVSLNATSVLYKMSVKCDEMSDYKNSFQIQIGGSGYIYSLNYERLLIDGKKISLAGLAGAGAAAASAGHGLGRGVRLRQPGGCVPRICGPVGTGPEVRARL